MVIAAAFLLLRSAKQPIKGDAAVALVSTGAVAAGVMAISFSTGMNIDVYNYMFGSVLAMSESDVGLSTHRAVGRRACAMCSFYSKIFSVTFDESFARATGVRAGIYNMLIALLTAVTIVIGMRLMGALLISALIIFPPLTAMRLFKSFKLVVIGAAAAAVVCFIAGITISYAYATPACASVVCVNILAFLICAGLGRALVGGDERACVRLLNFNFSTCLGRPVVYNFNRGSS